MLQLSVATNGQKRIFGNLSKIEGTVVGIGAGGSTEKGLPLGFHTTIG